ncbi:MAG: hypothetical protein R3F07_17950 [Opitutaceae bacterium]
MGHYKEHHNPPDARAFLAHGAAWVVIDYLAGSSWFLAGFGFEGLEKAAVFLLVALIGGVVTFAFPFINLLSRKHEY